jgi:hypothetical protein
MRSTYDKLLEFPYVSVLWIFNFFFSSSLNQDSFLTSPQLCDDLLFVSNQPLNKVRDTTCFRGRGHFLQNICTLSAPTRVAVPSAVVNEDHWELRSPCYSEFTPSNHHLAAFGETKKRDRHTLRTCMHCDADIGLTVTIFVFWPKRPLLFAFLSPHVLRFFNVCTFLLSSWILAQSP